MLLADEFETAFNEVVNSAPVSTSDVETFLDVARSAGLDQPLTTSLLPSLKPEGQFMCLHEHRHRMVLVGVVVVLSLLCNASRSERR